MEHAVLELEAHAAWLSYQYDAWIPSYKLKMIF